MSTKKFELLELIHDYDLDPQRRIIYLFDGINRQSAEKFIKNLNYLKSSEGEIKIAINTPGGNWVDGMAIYSAILHSDTHHITGYVMGDASSMGSIILQACDERVMDEFSWMLVHPGSTAYSGTVIDVISAAEFEKETLEQMYGIYYDKMIATVPKLKLTYKQFKNKFSSDIYLNAKKALELGLIDKIGVLNASK